MKLREHGVVRAGPRWLWWLTIRLAIATGRIAQIYLRHAPADVLKHLPSTAGRLRHLSIKVWSPIELSAVATMPNLRTLVLWGTPTTTVDFGGLSQLRRLELADFPAQSRLTSLITLPALESIEAVDVSAHTLSHTGTNIVTLKLIHPPARLPELPSSARLNKLILADSARGVNVGGLGAARSLRSLEVTHVKSLGGLDALRGHNQLEDLYIEDVPEMDSPEVILTWLKLTVVNAYGRHPISPEIFSTLRARGVKIFGGPNAEAVTDKVAGTLTTWRGDVTDIGLREYLLHPSFKVPLRVPEQSAGELEGPDYGPGWEDLGGEERARQEFQLWHRIVKWAQKQGADGLVLGEEEVERLGAKDFDLVALDQNASFVRLVRQGRTLVSVRDGLDSGICVFAATAPRNLLTADTADTGESGAPQGA